MRRGLLGALILAAAFALARGPVIKPTFKAEALAGAHEMVAYRLERAPVRFAVPAGQEVLRILINLDLPESPPAEGLPYSVRVRIPEDGRDQTFPLLALLRQRPNGTPAAFTLGGPVPAWTSEVMLTRPQTTAATIEVTLVAPARAAGALRVLARAHRPPLAAKLLAKRASPAERALLAQGRGPLDWDELPAELQAELLATHWTRLPAHPDTPRGRLYISGEPAPIVRPPTPQGDLATPGQLLAYTVRGPGTLRFSSVDTPLQGSVHLLYASAKEEVVPLALELAEHLDLPLAAGLVTARLRLEGGGRVLVLVHDAQLAIPDTRLHTHAGGGWELPPAWVLERYLATGPAADPPVRYDLAGRQGTEVRVTAHALMTCGDPPAAVQLDWTMRGAGGAALTSGTVRERVAPACEDRLDRDEAAVPSEPVALFLWPPPAAAVLEIASPQTMLVVLSSPAFDQPTEAPVTAGMTAGVVVRQQPADRPLWLRVRALNEDVLARAGRTPRLRLATRLEKHALPTPPSKLAETLEPLDQPPRVTLLVPDKAGAPAPDRGGYWPITAGVPTRVDFPAPPGAQVGARVPWSLLFLGDQALARGEAAVRVDGVAVTRTPLYTARGQIPLPPVAPGRHLIQLEAPGRGRLFVDHPTGGAAAYRTFGAYELSPGSPSLVRLAKGTAPRALGVVIYFDGAPAPHARLRVVIDAGRRAAPPGRAARARTRLVRTVPLAVVPQPTAAFLNRSASGVFAAAPLFVGLEDDIPAGPHTLRVTLEHGGRPRAFARYFSYNGSLRPERIDGFGQVPLPPP